MNNKNTKRALLTSVLSLTLCGSMLVGTTFAWFTDSVSSTNNVITAGNLDVELYYANAEDHAAGVWKKVEKNTKVFDQEALYEPGYTEVVYFKVVNEGSLALKYDMSLGYTETKGTNVLGDEFALSDYINARVIHWSEYDALTREGLPYFVALPIEMGAPLAQFETSVSATMDGWNETALLADEEIEVALALWMPSTVGNEANHNDEDIPEIDLSVNLVATQYTYEEDSFGNDYDRAPSWLGTVPASLEDTTLEIVPGDSAENRGTIIINSAEDLVYLSKLAKEWVSLYSNGQGTSVSYYNEKNGGKGAAYYYHWQWTIELGTDLDMNNIPMDSVDISYWGVFNGSDRTISNVVLKNGQDGLFNNGAKAINNLTVKNITVNAPVAQTVGAVAGNGTMTNVHVVNATVTGGKYVGGICGKGSSFINCSIKNATVTGTDKTVGGLVGYSIGDPNPATVTGNLVENVTVIGAYNVGGLLGQAQNETVENNTVKDVNLTSNASVPADATSDEVRTGQVIARNAGKVIVGENEVYNVNDFLPATPDTIQAEIDAAAAGTTIYLASAEFHTTINMKSGITLVGTKGTVVDCINLNGASNVTLQKIGFNAAGAQAAYGYNSDKVQTYANIVSGSKTSQVGARYIMIDGCTFTGKFANGGAAIAFTDKSRPTGGSGDVTIQNCVFNTENAYYDVYSYYTGFSNMTFTIENNTFASDCQGLPIYLGRLATSKAIVVKGNNFKTTDSLENSVSIQAHSATYTPTLDATDNTFGD